MDNPRKMIICCLAGYVACVAAGMGDEKARMGCGGDFEEAEHIITSNNLEPLDKHVHAAISLMATEENIRAVDRVAKELLDKKLLTEEEIEQLVAITDGESTEDEFAVWREYTELEARRQYLLEDKG